MALSVYQLSLSISELSEYLSEKDFRPSIEITWHQKEETDSALPWKGHDLPWNGLSCLSVISYVVKFCSRFGHGYLCDCISRLNDLASAYLGQRSNQKRREIAEMFVNDFMPKVKQFFTFSKSNENLPDFIHFLLQILNSETDCIEQEKFENIHGEMRSLQQLLTCLLAFLGDIPFQCTDLKEVRNLMKGFEAIANETGSFIYSNIFRTCHINGIRFYVGVSALLENAHYLKEEIEELCILYSELSLPITHNPMNTDAPDSLFIVESLIADIESHKVLRVLWTDNMRDHIREHHEVLTNIHIFLSDINMSQEILEVKECVVQIRDIAYGAEYIINSFVVENLPEWYLSIRIPNVTQKLKGLGERLQRIRAMYRFNIMTVTEDYAAEFPSQDMVPTPMVVDESAMVGFTNEMVEILDELTRGSENLQFISIFGMPGIGKTTLAKKLYNGRLITNHFDERAWCVVSQSYPKRKILTDILMCFRDTHDKDKLVKMDEEKLLLEIYQTLTGRRYLIVLDDVWDSDVWDDLRRFFPKDTNGSKILSTTRIRDSIPTNSIIHKLPLLSEDQCWELLEKRVFHDKPCPLELLGPGKQIAAKCYGLPLAVVVIAGVLINMATEESAWEKVERSLDTYTRNYMSILELSYKHLPNHLKLCFLYLGIFPEDANISTRKLIWLWIAEGFVRKEKDKSPEDVAEEYLMNLINRSLVQVAKNGSTGEVKACSIHGLVHKMCLKKAQERNFLNVIKDERNLTYKSHQRLCAQSTTPSHLIPFSIHCRSFFVHILNPSSCLPQMALMRVMELFSNQNPANTFYKLNKIDLLIHLKYLVVDRMPKPIIAKLVNLEVLRVENNILDLGLIPMVILKMVKLRHLHVKQVSEFENTNWDGSQPSNLKSLSLISTSNTDQCYEIFKSLSHLRKLKCQCSELPSFLFPYKLESLNITLVKYKYNTMINLQLTIKELTLCYTRLPWKNMFLLGRLPKLQALTLLSHAFIGKEWTSSDNEFQKLRFLKLEIMNLEVWIASSEHFPILRHIVLRFCTRLQNIPLDLGYIPTLDTIEIHYCSYGARMSVIHLEQEQRDNGNKELKVIITRDT